MTLDEKIKNIEAIFCSEFLEHMNNEKLESVLSKMESITTNKIVITVPNPISLHFKLDHSHILKYSIYSFLIILNKRTKFQYKMYPLGFAEQHLKKWQFRFLNIFASRIAIFSPTILYIGSFQGKFNDES